MMAQDSEKEEGPDIVINDAIHGVMSFDPKYKDIMKAIIDSADFQRLRHIKQLGMVDLIFPSAVHSRFNHCLGTAYVASQMALKLKLPPEIEKYAIIGSLLHDIGHGPFSHAFENLLKYEDENGKMVKIKHEDWTSNFVEKYKKILEQEGIDHNLISELIRGKYPSQNKTQKKDMNLVADIISSQLDADRLDYLLRDSHFCGVPYGKTDILRIISQLIKIQETGYPPRLGLERKGWRAAEHFLFCRRIMTQNIYHHHKKNVLENLLIIFLKDISDAIKENKTVNNMISNKKLREFLINSAKFRQGNVEPKDFIKDNFENYRLLTDSDIWMLIRDFSNQEGNNSESFFKIADRIYKRKIHYSFRFPETALGAVESIIRKITDKGTKNDIKLENWELFTTENVIQAYESEEDPILIMDEAGRTFRIQEYSNLLNIIGDKKEKDSYLAVDIEVWNNRNKNNKIRESFSKYVIFPEKDPT